MKLGIIIVNWNTGNLLANCLASLQALSDAERAFIEQVWVVDNNSSDDSVRHARKAINHANLPIKFIINQKNFGFAAGNNQALREVKSEADVLLLNPDTEVRPGALSALLKVLADNLKVGIVGPRLVNSDGSLQRSIRPFPTFPDFVLYLLKLGRVIQSRQEKKHDYSRAGYVDQVMGAAFLIRNGVLRDIGLLDEGFFALFEEVDYAKRAREAGWRTFYTPASTIMHVKGASFNQLIGWGRSLPWLRSCLHYASKHLAVWQIVLLYSLVPISLVLVIPASLKHLVFKYAR